MDVLILHVGKNAEALGENFLLCCCCYGPIPAVGKELLINYFVVESISLSQLLTLHI